MARRPLVITYALAYVRGEADLCAACLEDPKVRRRLPALGAVSHGAHRGDCDGCALPPLPPPRPGPKPRSGAEASTVLAVRVTDKERAAWGATAGERPVSEWIRATCNAAVPR